MYDSILVWWNVTLTSAPANLRLPANPTPPWTAIDVSCRNVTLALAVVGNGSSSTNVLFVDNRQLDTLTVTEMPSWSSQVQLYQQVNDTGPASSLSPYYMVMLARDLNDGGANMQGLSGSAVTYLGNSFLDLHGYNHGPSSPGRPGGSCPLQLLWVNGRQLAFCYVACSHDDKCRGRQGAIQRYDRYQHGFLELWTLLAIQSRFSQLTPRRLSCRESGCAGYRSK